MSARIDQVSSPASADGGSGTAETNVWVIGDDEEVIVIDPGRDAAAVFDVVGDREVLAVICTHGHADHVAAALEVADVQLEVIHAPGHTYGSVCLYCEKLGVVFTGHTLVAAGPAAQDGEFYDYAGQLTAIGEHLLGLPSDTRVLPGHGAETTIAEAEKKFDAWVAAGSDPSSLVGLGE